MAAISGFTIVLPGLLTVDTSQRLDMEALKKNEWIQGSNSEVFSMTPLVTPDVLSLTRSSMTTVQTQISVTMEAFHKAHRAGFRLQDVTAAPLARRRKLKNSGSGGSTDSSRSVTPVGSRSATPVGGSRTCSPCRTSPAAKSNLLISDSDRLPNRSGGSSTIKKLFLVDNCTTEKAATGGASRSPSPGRSSSGPPSGRSTPRNSPARNLSSYSLGFTPSLPDDAPFNLPGTDKTEDIKHFVFFKQKSRDGDDETTAPKDHDAVDGDDKSETDNGGRTKRKRSSATTDSYCDADDDSESDCIMISGHGSSSSDDEQLSKRVRSETIIID